MSPAWTDLKNSVCLHFAVNESKFKPASFLVFFVCVSAKLPSFPFVSDSCQNTSKSHVTFTSDATAHDTHVFHFIIHLGSHLAKWHLKWNAFFWLCVISTSSFIFSSEVVSQQVIWRMKVWRSALLSPYLYLVFQTRVVAEKHHFMRQVFFLNIYIVIWWLRINAINAKDLTIDMLKLWTIKTNSFILDSNSSLKTLRSI